MERLNNLPRVTALGRGRICIWIQVVWLLITVIRIKAIAFKGRNDFGSLCKIFLVLFSFSSSPLPSLFFEGLAIIFCEFTGFTIRFTEAIVFKENWLPFQNVMFLIFSRILGFFSRSHQLPSHSGACFTIRMLETLKQSV